MMTTLTILAQAEGIYEQAHKVTNRAEHVQWWDSKADVLNAIQDALETGAFSGEARDELKHAQYLISQAERIAGGGYHVK